MGKKKSSGAKRWARRLGLLALAIYGGLFAFGCTCADAMIFPAPKPSYGETLPGLVKIPLPGGGEAAALWVPKPGARTAILYLHGNGEDLGHDAEMLKEIRGYTGASVLGVDYPGYGLSPGKPSEEGCYRATEAAYQHLQGVFGFTPDNIVVFGRSLGTGPAVELVSRRRVKGLILVSPYTSTFRVMTKVKLLPFDRFDSLSKIARVQSPLLIVHGDADEVIPVDHARKLSEAAVNAPSRELLILPGADHNGGMPGKYRDKYREEINRIVNN